MLPDWLTDLEADEPDQDKASEAVPAQDFADEPFSSTESEPSSDTSSEIPDWLGDFESSEENEPDDSSGLDWLDNLANEEEQNKNSETDTKSQEDVVQPDSRIFS